MVPLMPMGLDQEEVEAAVQDGAPAFPVASRGQRCWIREGRTTPGVPNTEMWFQVIVVNGLFAARRRLWGRLEPEVLDSLDQELRCQNLGE